MFTPEETRQWSQKKKNEEEERERLHGNEHECVSCDIGSDAMMYRIDGTTTFVCVHCGDEETH